MSKKRDSHTGIKLFVIFVLWMSEKSGSGWYLTTFLSLMLASFIAGAYITEIKSDLVCNSCKSENGQDTLTASKEELIKDLGISFLLGFGIFDFVKLGAKVLIPVERCVDCLKTWSSEQSYALDIKAILFYALYILWGIFGGIMMVFKSLVSLVG